MHATARTRLIGRLIRHVAVVGGIAVLVAACSNAGSDGSTNRPGSQPAATSLGGTLPAPADLTLGLATDPTLGDYVTNEDGMALYVFLPDEGSAGSACNGECAVNWPPVTGAVAAGAGVTGEIGVVTRDDGTLQATLGGRPLYSFIGDEAAGDVNGQGLQGAWYLAAADGSPVGGGDVPSAEATPCNGRNCY